MPRAEWGEEKLPNISPRPGIINYSWELFIRAIFFCSVISFLLCTWPVKQWAMKLQELKIKFDVNTHATWSSIENFPNWHKLRHHASVRRRRGECREGSGSQVAAMMLETWECGWSGERGHVARVIWSSYITIRGRGWHEGTNDTRRQGERWRDLTTGQNEFYSIHICGAEVWETINN